MSATVTADPTAELRITTAGQIATTTLADGRIVRLSGSVGVACMTALRLALLMPLPEDCRDVLVDAGGVDEIDDPPLAVLLAARQWAESHGARFALSAASAAVRDALAAAGLADALPLLGAPRPAAPASVLAGLPAPRRSAD